MELIFFAIFSILWTYRMANGVSQADVTYKELEELHASCNTLDNCKHQRQTDTLNIYTCHCGSFCSQLNTCCIDSPFRNKPVEGFIPSCNRVYGMYGLHYFMVDKCPSSAQGDSIWEKLCEGADNEDLMSLVPVTSLSTNKTYKNYFCYRCHERENKYLYWNIKYSTNSNSSEENISLTYDKSNYAWMAQTGEENNAVPVTLTLNIPDNIRDLPKSCVLNVISNCSETWQNGTIRRKCNAYNSIVHFLRNGKTFSYKNPHCAICNYEVLEQMLCSFSTFARTTSKRPFSFSYLLDINRSDGDIVGEIQRCDDSSIWDPFSKKCRVLQCAIPGYVIKNRKCIPP